jgi:8-oxo-dGTP pyrophosphatase MutT (NUDIX family)
MKDTLFSDYIRFYTSVLPDEFAIVPLCVRVDVNGMFRKKRSWLAHAFFDLPQKNEVCASCVAYYHNKVLLLYDATFRHHVFPQGHRKLGERLRLTALRELYEESGFTDATVLKNIGSYRYRYPKAQFMIRKQIYVYLVRLNSLKKQPKKFEEHERYRNVFVSKRGAVAKLRWRQDQTMLARSLRFMK